MHYLGSENIPITIINQYQTKFIFNVILHLMETNVFYHPSVQYSSQKKMSRIAEQMKQRKEYQQDSQPEQHIQEALPSKRKTTLL